MGIDFTKMFEGMMAGYRAHQKENGVVRAEDAARRVVGFASQGNIDKLTSIFTQAAMHDGNMELSEEEFRQVISSQQFKDIVTEETDKRNNELRESQDPSIPNEPDFTGTPRDHVIKEKGLEFAEKVWDPMKELADAALKYMQENNGTLEKFSFTGFPNGVRLLSVGPAISYTNDSNDTMTIVDGQFQVTRHPDSAQALVVFEYNGETYRITSDNSTENIEPWNNPSYNE